MQSMFAKLLRSLLVTPEKQAQGKAEEAEIPRDRAAYLPRPLLTGIEQELYSRLKIALAGTCDVHAQVAMNRLVDIDLPERQKTYTKEWRQICQKSIDFVVTHTTKDGHMVIVAAIELDDRTHLRQDRQKSDVIKNEVFAEADIPLVRWQTRKMPTVAEIRTLFLGDSNDHH